MPEMVVSFVGGQKVAADYKGFQIVTDQPPRAGGDGSAPAPFDLFLASIGACAGFFVLNFCQTRKIPTEGIRVVQNTEHDPATHRLARVLIDIQVPADFPEKYYPALVRAVEQCAVKKAINDPPEFVTRTVVAP